MPDFAGSWYPGDAEGCLDAFQKFEQAAVSPTAIATPRAGVVPHAGWAFSGSIAYNVIRALSSAGDDPCTVLLFGGHLSPRGPASVIKGGGLWTPLGHIPTDDELIELLLQSTSIQSITPTRAAPDNTVELQLPLIKHFFPHARIVVIGAPPHPETLSLVDTLMEVAGKLNRKTIILGSTDLTHYGPNYGWVPQGTGAAAEKWVREENDRRLIDIACKMDPEALITEALQRSNACCPGAAAAAIRGAWRLGSREGELLVYATSSDIRPDESFVGYAGLLF